MKLSVITGIVLTLLLIGVSTLAFEVQPVAAADWWPMFRHDPSNTGYSTSKAPDTNNTIWISRIDATESSPAVVDGRVYIGSQLRDVYCLDASTGEHVWSYTTGDAVFSSPAVADGKVYVGSYDNNVYCLDASTGEHIWSYKTGSVVNSTPAVADGRAVRRIPRSNSYTQRARRTLDLKKYYTTHAAVDYLRGWIKRRT